MKLQAKSPIGYKRFAQGVTIPPPSKIGLMFF